MLQRLSDIYSTCREQGELILSQKERQRDFLPFETPRIICLGEPLGMTILDTAGTNVSEGLEQKHATDSQPAKNRCGIATAGCKIFEASP